MQSHGTPVALSPMLCSDFVHFLLEHHESPTVLVICCTREAFLEDLLVSLRKNSSQEPSASQNGNKPPAQYSLLVPTIYLISKSQSIHVVFVPTLIHLRAFLAAGPLLSKSGQSTPITTYSRSQSALLAIWGLSNLHRSTAEYSAQGLSRTLALAVEAASHDGQTLVLAEPLKLHDEAALDNDDTTEGTSQEVWKEQVPLLSGSVRYGGEERAWAGKTVEIGVVVGKWCRFVKLD